MKGKQRGDDHKLYCPTCKAGRNCMEHLMIRANDLQEQVTQLKADLATAKQGLEYIANPINAMQNDLKDGQSLDGVAAVYISNDPHWLKSVAQRTLDKIGKE